MLETDTGDVNLVKVGAINITAESNTGDIVLSDTVVEGAIAIETDTGDVNFSDSDGGVISVETNTGDVKGTMLSEKIFLIETDTGKINVPKTITGGKCEITTDTGDIHITIAN